jgi:hypothetical protein
MRPCQETIILKVTLQNRRSTRPIQANIKQGLAIHRWLQGNRQGDSLKVTRSWQISHAPSGYAISNRPINTYSEAVAARDFLLTMPLDWTASSQQVFEAGHELPYIPGQIENFLKERKAKRLVAQSLGV